MVDPAVIQDQMDFSRFVMLKIFLSAVTTGIYRPVVCINAGSYIIFTGLVSFSVLSMIPATKKKFAMARESFIAPLRSKGAASSMVGGAILGMGLTLSGAVSTSVARSRSFISYSTHSVPGWCLYSLVEEFPMQVRIAIYTLKHCHNNYYYVCVYNCVVYTLLGGFTGVLAYGMIHPLIRSAIKPAQPAKHDW